MPNEEVQAEYVAHAMLAMAETLRRQNPPKYKMAIKCARGASTFDISPEKKAFVLTQLGKLLLYYSDNQEEAKLTLENAYNMYLSFGDDYLNFRTENVILLCEAYIGGSCSIEGYQRALAILRAEMPNNQKNKSIITKMLFYYIEAATLSGSYNEAVEACKLATENAMSWNDKVLELYFRMTKQLVLSRSMRGTLDEVETNEIGAIMSNISADEHVITNLKVFYISTQLAYTISSGKMRSARDLLRTLQATVQAMPADVSLGGIRWMERVPLTALACLMTIVSSAFQSNYDRAYKYYLIGMRHIQEYLTKSFRSASEFGVLRSVLRMRLSINEMIAHCNIMACKPVMALENIRDMITLSTRVGMEYYIEYVPAIQSLLGWFSTYIGDLNAAEKHFKAALEMKPKNKDAFTMLQVSLGLVYILQQKFSSYYTAAEFLTPTRLSQCSLVVKMNAKFVMGCHAYITNKLTDCQQYLVECLEMAKAEDLFRIHAMAIVLFSIPFPVSVETLQLNLDWSKKGQDYALLNWSDLAIAINTKRKGDDAIPPNDVDFQKCKTNLDAFQEASKTHSAAGLLEWYEGEALQFLPKEE